jgi:uncharacterized membrane protein YcjF (UPF0283 family)
MASIAARLTVLCDRPDPRLRMAAVLFSGAVFGLAVAAASALLILSLWGRIEWILLVGLDGRW